MQNPVTETLAREAKYLHSTDTHQLTKWLQHLTLSKVWRQREK